MTRWLRGGRRHRWNVLPLLALSAWAAGICGFMAEARASGEIAMRIGIGGGTRTYLMRVPPSPAPFGGFPVVLAFHGGGGQARSMVRLANLGPLADRRDVLLIYPDGIGRHWNDGRASIKNRSDDIGFVGAILDEVERAYPIDRGRIFATGISNGAMFVHRLACELSGRISAIAAVSGAMPADIAPSCRPVRPVSVLQVGGTADPIAPFRGGAVADFGGRGEGGIVLSDSETAALWSRLDGCAAPEPPVALPPVAAPDGTRVVRTDFARCRSGTTVRQLTIEGGGQAWPGGAQYLPERFIGTTSRQLDASAAIVEFFLIQPRSRAAER